MELVSANFQIEEAKRVKKRNYEVGGRLLDARLEGLGEIRRRGNQPNWALKVYRPN